MEMPAKKIYFLSDAHLGSCLLTNNSEREDKLVRFLETIQPDCSQLFLLGDMFDFWFEYKHVVPKGHTRFLAQLRKFSDAGIEVHFFIGNHDIWSFGYLEEECGVILHTDITPFNLQGKAFLIGHGDGLDPRDKGFLLLRRVFHNRFLQKCFQLVHPDWGIRLANAWSSYSRLKKNGKIEATPYRGDEKEDIVLFCKKMLTQHPYDYFMFGHRHLPIDISLSPKSRYINTGDWITHFSYAVFDGENVQLKTF